MKNQLIIFLLLLLPRLAEGQTGGTASGKYPRVLLVQLRSERNRIEALNKARRYKDAEEVAEDARQVVKRIMQDFQDNFSFCPVYYYMDTNSGQIEHKQFANMLFNADGSKPTDLQLTESSTDYVIAYFGKPVSQSRADKTVTDSLRYTYDPETVNGKGLVILNDKFLQISYLAKTGFVHFSMGKKAKKAYYYSSRHYDIEYFPLAEALNSALAKNDNKGK